MADPAVLLDSSALLALILRERGADRVMAVLDQAAISAVSLTEVIEVAIRKGQPPEQAAGLVAELALPVLPFDADTAADAARLLVANRRHDLSLGDCACIATARQHGLPVLTADRAWAALDLGVEVRLIR